MGVKASLLVCLLFLIPVVANIERVDEVQTPLATAWPNQEKLIRNSTADHTIVFVENFLGEADCQSKAALSSNNGSSWYGHNYISDGPQECCFPSIDQNGTGASEEYNFVVCGYGNAFYADSTANGWLGWGLVMPIFGEKPNLVVDRTRQQGYVCDTDIAGNVVMHNTSTAIPSNLWTTTVINLSLAPVSYDYCSISMSTNGTYLNAFYIDLNTSFLIYSYCDLDNTDCSNGANWKGASTTADTTKILTEVSTATADYDIFGTNYTGVSVNDITGQSVQFSRQLTGVGNGGWSTSTNITTDESNPQISAINSTWGYFTFTSANFPNTLIRVHNTTATMTSEHDLYAPIRNNTNLDFSTNPRVQYSYSLHEVAYTNSTNYEPGSGEYCDDQVSQNCIEVWAIIMTEAQPPEPVENTSMYAAKYGIGDFALSSSSYVEIENLQFTTVTSRDNILMTSFNVEKISGGATTNVVSARVLLNGTVLIEEVVRTVTGTGDIGSVGISPVFIPTGSGIHNVTIEMKRSGNGAINITNFDASIGRFRTTAGNDVRGNLTKEVFSFTTQTYQAVYNWTIPKTFNSSTYTAGAWTVTKTTGGAASVKSFFENQIIGAESPHTNRYLSSDSDIGSVSNSYIDINETGNHVSSIYAQQSDVGATVTFNGTILDFDLKDAAQTPINFFSVSNEYTNRTGTQSYTQGTHLLTGDTLYVNDGNGTFISVMVSLGTTTGSQTPTIWVNSTDVPESVCYSEKQRYLSNNNDVGNIKIYYLCEGIDNQTTYDFALWLEVPAGETVVMHDESLSVFEVTFFNTTEINTPPIVSITDPNHNDTINGTYPVKWITTDTNGDTWTSNITIKNDTINFIGIGLDMTQSTHNFHTTSYQNGNYSLNVSSCENNTLEMYCGSDQIGIAIFNAPQPNASNESCGTCCLPVLAGDTGFELSVIVGLVLCALLFGFLAVNSDEDKKYLQILFLFVALLFVNAVVFSLVTFSMGEGIPVVVNSTITTSTVGGTVLTEYEWGVEYISKYDGFSDVMLAVMSIVQWVLYLTLGIVFILFIFEAMLAFAVWRKKK